MEKWEYKVVTGLSEDELNDLGRYGWELVTVTLAVTGDGSHICVLKRSMG